MSDSTVCCRTTGDYCHHCNLLDDLPGLHVVKVDRHQAGLRIVVESARPSVMGCPGCGVVVQGHGRMPVELIDAPCFTAPVRVQWRKRRWRCLDPDCTVTSFTEQNPQVAAARALLTVRATRWAIQQLRSENASIQGLARQLGCTWKTLWRAVKPVLQATSEDEFRFAGVTVLGVDEHIWHHVSTRPVGAGGRGPKEFTGMVDLTRDSTGRVRARLLDLVPGRSGKVYKTWLHDRGEAFRAQVKVATLDPFHGYKNAIDDQLEDSTAVLDAFHVVKLGTAAVDEVRRRVQQDIHGHRGRKNDPLYRIRNLLRAGKERLTPRQHARLENAFLADERHVEVEVAWHCAQQLRSVYRQPHPVAGRRIAIKVLDSFPTCPIPEIARLGRTLKRWREPFLGYFTTDGANNGGTEAINGVIELARRVARGFRSPENYRLRMLLVGGGLNLTPHSSQKSPKTWHAGSKYEKVIWRCGHKYKGDTMCTTGHINDERLKYMFLEAIRLRFGSPADDTVNHAVLDALDTSDLEVEAAGLIAQLDQVAKKLESLIAHNARVAQDQQVYEKAFNASHEQHQALLAEHAAVVDEIHNKHNRLAAYHYYRQETANLDLEQLVFSPYLCVALLDKGTVNIDGTVTFHFRDDSTQVVAIKADIGQAPGCD